MHHLMQMESAICARAILRCDTIDDNKKRGYA